MICIFIETRDGKIKKASLEALSEGRRKAEEMNQEAVAVLVGQSLESLAPEVLSYGAAKAYLLENPLLSHYSPQGYALALRRLVEGLRPEIIFFSATSLGKDLAPRLAAGLNVGLASDCTKVEVKNGRLEYTRPIYAGKAQLSFFLKSSPQVATLRPNVFPLRERAEAQGEMVKEEVILDANQVKARITEFVCGKGEELDVSEADIIVSGGRGIKGPENFGLLRELAAVLPRSAVGASRSAVDSGWIGHQHQVGQTGKTVSPTLYMAFGISGAIQHLAGMSSSKFIVAVNKDPEAPIFKVADYGIVGDLFQVIPALREEFRKLLVDEAFAPLSDKEVISISEQTPQKSQAMQKAKELFDKFINATNTEEMFAVAFEIERHFVHCQEQIPKDLVGESLINLMTPKAEKIATDVLDLTGGHPPTPQWVAFLLIVDRKNPYYYEYFEWLEKAVDRGENLQWTLPILERILTELTGLDKERCERTIARLRNKYPVK